MQNRAQPSQLMVAQVQNPEGLEGTVGMRDEGWLPGGGGALNRVVSFPGAVKPQKTEKASCGCH